MKSKKNITLLVLLVIGVVVVVNYLSTQFFFRLDFTEDKRFTLSDATKDILRELEEPVTVTAYFSEDLPPQLDQVKNDVRDMLAEYSSRSKGMLAYEFLDPLKDDKIKQEAAQAGVQQMQVYVEEKDQQKAQAAFMGLNIQLGEDNEAIPMIPEISGLEYKMTTAIKKLSISEKPVVGFVQGHGEPGFGDFWEAKQALDVLHRTELVDLSDSALNLNKYNTLAIVRPTDSLSLYDLRKLDEFVSQGGNLFIAIDRSDANLNQEQYSHSVSTGLETWLATKGVDVNNNAVIDLNCFKQLVQPRPGYLMQLTVPYIIYAQNFTDHPIVSGLERVTFNFVSSITFSGDSALKFTPLIKSSENSGTKPSENYINLGQEWSEADFPLSELTLAAAIEGKFNGNANTKMVVVGDGGFSVTDQMQPQISPDNLNLMVNSIDWLSDETGLVTLRTRGATARPLDDIEEGRRTFLKYLNFLLPVLLALIYGIIRFQRNRFTRIKRMEEGYVQ